LAKQNQAKSEQIIVNLQSKIDSMVERISILENRGEDSYDDESDEGDD
jgi:hypothetical protein